MDYYIDHLKLLIEQNGGIVSAQDIQNAGIDRALIYDSLVKGIISKESHGNYVLADDKPDEFRIIQSRSDKLIFSHGTALFLHGMSDRVPHKLDITVPQGDNVSRIKKRYEHTKFHYCKKELWDLGIITIKTPQGYDVRAYDLERCICDLIRDKKDIDLGPGQADIHLAGEHTGHHLIRAAAVHQVDFQSLIGKKAQRHGRVLRGVEHRVRHLADTHPNGFFGQRGHGGAQQAQSKQQDHSLSHADTPKCFFSAFSRKSTP